MNTTLKKIICAALVFVALCGCSVKDAGATKPSATRPTVLPTQTVGTEPGQTTAPTESQEETTAPTEELPTIETTVPVETEPETVPTEPEETIPETEPAYDDPDGDMLSYEEYLAMTPAEQQEYYESFGSLEDYIEWYNAAYDAYEQSQSSIIVTGGSIDIGDFMDP